MVDEKLIEKMWCNVPEAPEFRENIEIVEVNEPGYVHFTMDIPKSLGNYRGGIHGGTHATFQIIANPKEGKIGYRAVFPYVAAAALACFAAFVVLAGALIHKRRKTKRLQAK